MAPLIINKSKDIDDAKPTLFSLKAVRIINIAIVSVDLPGPPPVKARTLSYNLKEDINITTVFIVKAGASKGQSKYLNFCILFAPSIYAASSNSLGIFFKLAKYITVQKAINCQHKATEIEINAILGFPSQLIFIWSENSAKNFLSVIKKYELVDYWMNTNLMCIGEKTSAVLNELKWKKIFLFNPGEEEFLLYKI